MKQVIALGTAVVLAMVALGVALITGLMLGLAVGAASGAGLGGFAGRGVAGLERQLGGTGPEKIAIIKVIGPISQEVGGFFGVGASSRQVVALLDRAQNDAQVRGVILDMNTPGGGVTASSEIHQKLLAVRRTGKTVVTLMTEVAASGGYYIAAGTDHIVADPTTITGSIGVIVALANIQELSRKIGLRTIVFKSGEFKDMGSPDRPVSRQEAALFQGLVNEAYARFVDVVATGRKMDRARVRQLADGRIYTGQQAQRLGLVDSLGHLPQAIEVAKKRARLDDPLIVEYGTEGLLRSLLGATSRQVRAWLGGPAALVPDLYRPFSVQYLMTP
ncbi:MAG: signal peptide peptidase SppA [Armatimonadota bacterium]|nr:signal peptide peptidase SppA [Armatimonadota bacterium]